MEDRLDLSRQVERIFLYKEFEKICPYYISMGMTYDQFWKDDISIATMYRKAFKIKEKREAIKQKWTIWEQGLYIYEALCDVSPILRAFSKATKPLQYPEKPFKIEELYEDKRIKMIEDEKKEKEKEVEIIKTQIYFQNWTKSVQKRFEEKEVKDA